MADDSNRIGSTRISSTELLRQLGALGGVGGAGAAGSGTVAAPSSSGASTPRGAFGPRGNRMLPADFPTDQLDRKAARGTYLDILV